MPIIETNLDAGILHFQKKGHLDQQDATQFEQAVQDAIANSPLPLVILIDARSADLMTPDVSRAYMRVMKQPKIKVLILTTSGFIVTQSARVMALRDQERKTHVFEDWNEAVHFALEQAENAALSG